MEIAPIGLGRYNQLLKYLHNFEHTSDVDTTYTYKLCPTGRNFEIESQIFVHGNCTSQGALMDKTPMRVFFDTGASKGYMSKYFIWAILVSIPSHNYLLPVKV